MTRPIINLLKHRVDVPQSHPHIIELCETAREHLNIMYRFDDECKLNRNTLNFRANCIARWLHETHSEHRECHVIIGDMPALVPALSSKLSKYGFKPLVLLNSPTSYALPKSERVYDMRDTLILAEV